MRFIRIFATAAFVVLFASQTAKAQNYEYEEDYDAGGDWYETGEEDGAWYQGQEGGYHGTQGGYYGPQGGYGPRGGYQGQKNNENPFGETPLPPGSHTEQLVDQGNPRGVIVAFEHAIPPGWRANGQVIWQQRTSYAGCGYDDQHIRWAARAPDCRQEMGYWPQVIYSGVQGAYINSNPSAGCENISVQDPQAFLKQHIARVRPGARIKSYLAPTHQEQAL